MAADTEDTEPAEPTGRERLQRGAVYVVRFGFTWRVIANVVFGLFMLAVAVLPPYREPTLAASLWAWLFRLLYALLGLGGLIILAAAISRRVALRVAPGGLTIGSLPHPLHRGPPAFTLRWEDVHVIVLYHQQVHHGGITTRLPYLAVQVHPGTWPRPSPLPRGVLRWILRTFLPRTLRHIAEHSVPITGWHLDRTRLIHAVAAQAPHVAIREITDDGHHQLLTPRTSAPVTGVQPRHGWWLRDRRRWQR